MTYFGSKVNKSQPRKIKARKELQEKIGTGQINPFVLERIQEYIDNIKIDYQPIAEKYLQRLDALILEFEDERDNHDFYIKKMIDPVMELKATGGMFNEKVISSISGTVLNILEGINTLDDDMLEILRAHNRAINAAISMNVRSLDDYKSNALLEEVQQACMRYLSKNRKKFL